MMISPYYMIIALGCLAGAVLMFTRFRDQAEVTFPAGILLALGGIYLLCRQFFPGLADSSAVSWVVRGVLVVFLIYLLLCWNNLKAERSAEFDTPPQETADKSGETEPDLTKEEPQNDVSDRKTARHD